MSSLSGTAHPSGSINLTDLPVHAGQVLDGKFRVERIIGEGAMGLVVEATHLDLDERVALKFLRQEARERPDIVARFAREARAAAKIKSDHVARVYDVGGAGVSPFIVMEYLEGSDLENVLATRGRLPIMDAVEYVIQACEGLTAAHAHGIVHRDIKPGNLFLVDRGGSRHVKLVDFGISKAGMTGSFEDIDLALANTTQIMGSPHYMSPEQIRSTKDVDLRADVWSIGVVLYELITGETPFTATEVTGIIAQVLYEPHRSVRSLLPDVPQGLVDVIDHCLEKEPASRCQSAADLAVALLPFAPKRARALVERATAVLTRAAGGSGPADSLPPPPLSSASITGRSTGPRLAAQAVPSPVPAKSAKNGALLWVAIACVIVGVTGSVLAGVARLRTPVTAETPTRAPSTALVSPAAAASPSAADVTPSATQASTAEVATPKPITSVARVAGAQSQPTQPAPTAQPAPTVRPTAKAAHSTTSPRAAGSGSAVAPPSENEIRLER